MSSRRPPAKQPPGQPVQPRRCLFCGGRPLSLEHAWPGWLLRALGVFEPKVGIMEAQFGPEEEPHRWPGAEIKSKHFCKACNSGWMSALEAQAKPIITPLLADLAVPLDTADQHVLARWTIKTAIVFETTGPKDRPSLYTQSDRDQVASPASALPLGTMVLVGRHSESNVMFATGRVLAQPVMFGPTRKQGSLEEGYATTFWFGRLVLQVVRVKCRAGSTMKRIKLESKPGPWNRLLIPLWPRQRAVVQWPPAFSLSETGTSLEQLSERLGLGLTQRA